LAEDPRVDQPSGSRYARMGESAQTGSLYAKSRRPLGRGKQSGRKQNAQQQNEQQRAQQNTNTVTAIRRNHEDAAAQAAADGKTEESVGRLQTAGSFDRLELGSDGRLFGVVDPAAKETGAVEAIPRPQTSAGTAAQAQTAENGTALRQTAAASSRARAARPAEVNPLMPGRSSAQTKTRSAGRNSAARTAANPLMQGSNAAVHTAPHVTLPAVQPRELLEKAGAKIRGQKKVLLAACGVAAAVAYGAMAVHYADCFYPGTEIYGIRAGGMSAAEVKAAVETKISTYSLKIEERGSSSERVSAEDVALAYDDQGRIESAMKNQKSYFWPVMMLLSGKTDAEIGTTYDRACTADALADLKAFQSANIVEPADAMLIATDTGYAVKAEVMGTKLDASKTLDAVCEAVGSGKTVLNLEEAGCYVDPQVYSDDADLNAQAAEINAVFGADFTLDFGDRSEAVNASVVREFISLDPDGNYYIDENKVRTYVDSLAERYDTWEGERVFYTSLGYAVRLSGGDYGWEMDREATTAAILEAVEQKQTDMTVEPVYIHTAQSRSVNDIGDTYVEVSIAAQHMWCYVDGYLLVDTDVVTGSVSEGNDTPSGGVWSIDSRERNAILRGEDYVQPVDYWIGFNGGVGIHDLQTRYVFGSTVYLTNGSHGCVNTPLEAMEIIFDAVSIGQPVIVYDDAQIITD